MAKGVHRGSSTGRYKVMLVRPPRYLWPVVNESDNYMMPLGLPCLAAMVRREIPNCEVRIVDCPPLKIGWNSLRRIIEDEKPDLIGAGEEALYSHEAVRLFRLAKSVNPDIVTVAGGHFFSWLPEQAVREMSVDYVVRYEGEVTFAELVQVLMDGGDLRKVKGIAFLDGEELVLTEHRPPVKNLDDLPIAAYDLLPMGKYSPLGYFWRQGAAIEHGRGCIDRCTFCSLWTFWGKQNASNHEVHDIDVSPCYRTKSVDRTLEEIDILYKQYDRRVLLWNDPTFAVQPKWTEEFCDRLIARNYKDLYSWAFLRADFVVRDEKLGILEKMVKAGLINAFIGVERKSTEDYEVLDKHYTQDVCKQAFQILKDKYPHVHRQGTLLTGLRSETKESLLAQVDYALDIGVEFGMFHPVTPVPGTMLYAEAIRNNWIEDEDLRNYNWLRPVMKIENMTTKELADLTKLAGLKFITRRWRTALAGLVSPVEYRRRLYWWFLSVFVRGMATDLYDLARGHKEHSGFSRFLYLHKPDWYDD